MSLNFEAFERAMKSLENAVMYTEAKVKASTDIQELEILKAGGIQNFEIAYELSWKFMKRWLKEQETDAAAVDGFTRNELLREAKRYGLINELDQWLAYHRARNESSHNYNETVAMETHQKAREFLADGKLLLKNMQARNS